MALQRIFTPPFIVIIFLSLASCFCSFDIDESTYNDFEAYPSYFSTIDTGNFYNFTNILLDSGTYYGLNKFSRLENSARTVYVDSFGAKGDGTDDDTQAFQKAWKETCSSAVAVNFVVSKGKNYRLKPIRFSGPCRSQITMQILGSIEASDDRSDYSKDGRHWIVFDSVKNLVVEGGGIINGNGKIWWQNSCKINKALPCKDAPTAVTFYQCQNLAVENIKIQNAQQIHMSFEKCTSVQASNLVVTAPEKSPNTDGIHVTETRGMQISSCTIGTGDDCISIVNGSRRVQATDITCGPGHGISIGSLGEKNSEAYVSDITVNGAKLTGTTNGVRIKTWQGGSGSASNIKFHNVEMHNVKNPIIIDQNYCDQSKPCIEQRSAVQVSNVLYQNIKGTSASEKSIIFNCSKSFPCKGIVMQNIDLVGEEGEATKAVCNNVRLINAGGVSPRCP